MTKMECDIIIPVFNSLELTRNCLLSIIEKTRITFNIILIDNANDGKAREFLEEFKSSNHNVRLVRNEENMGWVKAINQGMRLSSNPYICIMNNDTIVRTDGWLYKMIQIAEREPDIGLVNPHFQIKRDLKSEAPYIEIDYCRGYCVLIKRPVIEKIGLLDEAYGMGYYDDDDYSVRAVKERFRCVRANNVIVEHLRNQTFITFYGEKKIHELHEKNKRLFTSKWGRRLRLVFLIRKGVDKHKVSSILLSLARKQHVIYLWHTQASLYLPHLSIKERLYPSFIYPIIVRLKIYLNGIKNKSKHYDIIFTDDPVLNEKLAKAGRVVHVINIDKDESKIGEIANSASRP